MKLLNGILSKDLNIKRKLIELTTQRKGNNCLKCKNSNQIKYVILTNITQGLCLKLKKRFGNHQAKDDTINVKASEETDNSQRTIHEQVFVKFHLSNID